MVKRFEDEPLAVGRQVHPTDIPAWKQERLGLSEDLPARLVDTSSPDIQDAAAIATEEKKAAVGGPDRVPSGGTVAG